MVSYEAALGLSLARGAVELRQPVDQRDRRSSSPPGTGTCGPRASCRSWCSSSPAPPSSTGPPFDLVEAEQELVGGFHTEYSSIRFALFFLAEFMNTVTMSAIIVTLFFGGPNGPSFGLTGWVSQYVLPFMWFFLKLVVFLFIFVMFRSTLPRFRYDQLMDLGWKVLIPLSLGWFLVLTATKVADDQDWNLFIVIPVGDRRASASVARCC